MSETASTELIYQIILTQLPGVGTKSARKLVNAIGSAEAIFKEKPTQLALIPTLGEQVARLIKITPDLYERAEKELAFIDKFKIRTLYLTDEAYPLRLKQCADAPVLLYTLGNADYNSQRIVSVVGTRSPTDYGKEMCRYLVKGLADLDVLVVSGLAYGIDTVAHKSALDASIPTVGVLAHGLDRVYPSVNSDLAHKMIQNGGLVTEFISNNEPDRENFPMRNRIIAGLADATIVIEAGSKGGALITADIANSYDRDVFAVPGRVSDKYSEGCNTLIKTNRAALVQKPEDILYIMGWEKPADRKQVKQKELFIDLDPNQEAIVKLLKEEGECGIDKICSNCNLSPGKLASILLDMECNGLVLSLPGKVFKLSDLN